MNVVSSNKILSFIQTKISKLLALISLLVYSPKKLITMIISVIFVISIIVFCSQQYSNYKRKLLIQDLQILQNFTKNNQKITLESFKKLKIHNHNIKASLLIYYVNKNQESIDLEEIKSITSIFYKTKPDDIIWINFQYSLAISYLKIAKRLHSQGKQNENIKLFNLVNDTRDLIKQRYNANKTNKNNEYLYNIQKQLEVNKSKDL